MSKLSKNPSRNCDDPRTRERQCGWVGRFLIASAPKPILFAVFGHGERVALGALQRFAQQPVQGDKGHPGIGFPSQDQ